MHTPEPLTGTVLIIDRSERMAKEKAIFEDAGMTVITANTAEEGLRLAQEQRPTVVVSEVMLEKPDAGFVLGYRMKKDAELADTPLVLLSSIFQSTGTIIDMSSPEARQWIKADLYLERPVAADHLLAKVAGLLHRPTAAA